VYSADSSSVTVYGVFTAAVQLPDMYDSFGDLNRIQPQYHTSPWKVSLLWEANSLFVHLLHVEATYTVKQKVVTFSFYRALR